MHPTVASVSTKWNKEHIMAQAQLKYRIPKDKRRKIMVDGTRYEYCVTGFISIFLRNLHTDERFTWHMEVEPKWRTAITPVDIRTLIQTWELVGIRMTRQMT